MELQIHHTCNQNGSAMFEVIRSMDMKRTAAVALPDPAKFPVEGHPAKQFLPELRWYLENYLQSPFGVYPQLAECVAKTMQVWGAMLFDTLFTGYARDWYQDAKRRNFQGFRIKITSDSPEIMSWPWEALYSGDDGWLALRCCIARQLSSIGDPPPLPSTPTQEAIHILYVIPRPYGENDVSYNILANSLVEYISQNRLPVTMDILRPPTFDQLRKVLYDHPGHYHIVHFDGHGGYGAVMDAPAGNLYAAPEGQLIFETDSSGPDPVDTRLLAQLLAEYNIPFMVVNACQSGMIDNQAQDPFASVAAGLLKAGVRSVVAMGYSLYVSGAKAFIPAFYERLFSTGKVSEAVRAGRGKMLRQSARDCIVGQLPLQDWVVPILYQQLSSESAVLPRLRSTEGAGGEASVLPTDARVDGDYGFIGRGRDIQRLERAMLRQPQTAILIHGQAGVGKTSLAKGFLRWLSQTGGLRENVFWFNFQKIHSAEYVINQLLDELANTSSLAKPKEEKQKILTQLLRNRSCLLVWDNFESASGIDRTEIQPQLSAEDRDILARLLKELRAGKTKVLLTSRNEESWLPVSSCYRLPLGGLAGEDLWEYCNAVVRDLGLTLDRSNETYAAILDRLCGNPLAIRSILLRLQHCSARQLLTDLKSSFEGMEGDESTRRLKAAYAVFGSSLTERYLPVLQVTGLHDFHVDADYVKAMLNATGYPVEPDMVNACYHILENAGFCTHIGQNVYQLHPALRGYLLRQTPAPEPLQISFADIMGRLAHALTGKPLYQVKTVYERNIENFYYARRLAEAQDMDICYMALTQSLAYHAQEMRRLAEANKLYLALVEKTETSNDWKTMASTYHQLGIIAQEQRDFSAAEGWYKKSLAIEEKLGNEHGAAITYHQLGIIAQVQRDFSAAEGWYKKSLAITEKLGNEHGAASTYHQLGIIAQKQRDFSAAEGWYKKALAIKEKQGNEHGAASTYHQLGTIAQEQRDFVAAEGGYKKALAIKEKQGNEHGAASTYHQLGIIAQEQRDFAAAEGWYKKALVIEEKQSNEHSAASTYHQLGTIAQEQRDFAAAEGWYKKSLAIKEKQGNEHDAASTYHQLGRIAQEQCDFAAAEGWYKKSLAIKEKQGNEHYAASTYHQLGRIAEERQDFPQACDFYLKSIQMFTNTNDAHNLMVVICSYARLLHTTAGTEHSQVRQKWTACMPQELTEILEEMEAKLNDVNR